MNHKDEILKIIKRNDRNIINNFIIQNNILLNELNDGIFDILIYSIENDISLDIIKFIINQCHYQNFNYPIYDEIYFDMRKSPLFTALAKNNFEIATILIKNNAMIYDNYNTILYYLLEFNLLNKKNLKFILTVDSNAKYFNNYILELILSSIENNNSNDSQLLSFLKQILYYYSFNIKYILKLLNCYKNYISLSTQQIHTLLVKENNKFIIDDNCYKEAIYYGLNNVVDILFKYDSREETLLLNIINKYRTIGTFEEDMMLDEKEFNEEIFEKYF
ncbi:hypothetical protein BCR32DRAFT_247584 [Anaeromyces robustus]|uniref:Ankyrin n=1 Tax=Anaeromyces robustus TaxID=1754192 RepID=A0A1Y1WX16_9FUNG|nr:hypothetical protein BCR32DRAFT_247584 [Anaeromyces robustus]|eukprot:ORX77878.1 hypothetical protein BCR32DRAFT_247584 [Anaeromyces robustus]